VCYEGDWRPASPELDTELPGAGRQSEAKQTTAWDGIGDIMCASGVMVFFLSMENFACTIVVLGTRVTRWRRGIGASDPPGDA
jgi:hypothetical protein